jgi:hypothetical protein
MHYSSRLLDFVQKFQLVSQNPLDFSDLHILRRARL